MEMFDVAREKPINLSEAADYLPRSPGGAKISHRTIERYIRHGHQGVFLEGTWFADRLMTSKESIDRFCKKCTALRGAAQPAAPGASPRAKAFLESQGVGAKRKPAKKAS